MNYELCFQIHDLSSRRAIKKLLEESGHKITEDEPTDLSLCTAGRGTVDYLFTLYTLSYPKGSDAVCYQTYNCELHHMCEHLDQLYLKLLTLPYKQPSMQLESKILGY